MSAEDLLNEPDDFIPPDPKTYDELKSFFDELSDEEFMKKEKGIIAQYVYRVTSKAQLKARVELLADHKIKRNLLQQSDRKAFIERVKAEFVHPLNRVPLSGTSLSDWFYNHPIKVDLIIPESYSFELSVGGTHGIYEQRPDREGIPQMYKVSPHIILPYEIVEDSSDTSGTMLLRMIVWNPVLGVWEYFPAPVPKGAIITERGIGILNEKMQITLAEEFRKPMAKFLADLMTANNGLRHLPINHAVSACGWTKEGLFFPFTTDNTGNNLIFTGDPGTTVAAVYETSKTLPAGERSNALKVLCDLKDNHVFSVVFAGCLASPLISKLGGILKENIGIDISGKTSAGKTTIQILAVDLLYGLGEAVKSSWSNAKLAGIWRFAEDLNNLPFILDDSHRQDPKHADTPHDLINSKEGNKSKEVGGSKRWGSKDSTKSQYRGTILFNGEVPITFLAPDNSAGIYGRIFLIERPPFPATFTKDDVQKLSRAAELNGGHFAKEWIEHIATLNINDVIARLDELEQLFHEPGKDDLYGRLSTKATVLVFCLEEFNKLFGVNVNVSEMVKLLKQSMMQGVANVNVADRIMKLIVDKIFEQAINHSKNDKNCILFEFGTSPDLLGLKKANDVCYKDKERLIITNSVLEKILDGKNFGSSENVRKKLHDAGYLIDSELKRRSYPATEGQNKDHAKMYGMVFPYESFERFIEEEKETTDTQEKPTALFRLPGLPEA